MSKQTRLNVTILPSTKERLLRYCADHEGLNQGDVVDAALKNFFEHIDRQHTAPDLVLDRINQLTLSVMQLNQTVGAIHDKVIGFDE